MVESYFSKIFERNTLIGKFWCGFGVSPMIMLPSKMFKLNKTYITLLQKCHKFYLSATFCVFWTWRSKRKQFECKTFWACVSRMLWVLCNFHQCDPCMSISVCYDQAYKAWFTSTRDVLVKSLIRVWLKCIRLWRLLILSSSTKRAWSLSCEFFQIRDVSVLVACCPGVQIMSLELSWSLTIKNKTKYFRLHNNLYTRTTGD